MRYLGKIAGKGVLRRKGLRIGDAAYEIEAFQHNQGLIRASGELTVLDALPEGLGALARMQLLTESGDLLELKRPNPDKPIGRHINFEVVDNLVGVKGWLRH